MSEWNATAKQQIARVGLRVRVHVLHYRRRYAYMSAAARRGVLSPRHHPRLEMVFGAIVGWRRTKRGPMWVVAGDDGREYHSFVDRLWPETPELERTDT